MDVLNNMISDLRAENLPVKEIFGNCCFVEYKNATVAYPVVKLATGCGVFIKSKEQFTYSLAQNYYHCPYCGKKFLLGTALTDTIELKGD